MEPCSVNAKGSLRRPPQLDVAKRDFKFANSSGGAPRGFQQHSFYAEDYHQQYLAKNPDGYCGLKGTGVSCPIGGRVVIPAAF